MINYNNLIEYAKNKIPQFAEKYDYMIGIDEIDSESGNHIVFGYVFTPILIDAIKNNDKQTIETMFSFMDEMSTSDDVHVIEVCDQSIIEALYDEFGDDIEQYMGNKTKDGLKAVKQYMY